MKVKICGIVDASIAKLADQNYCDFLGVVFYNKSPRYVEIKDAKKISQVITKAKKVAVVVEPKMDYLDEIISNFVPDFIQFHGQIKLDFFEQFKEKFPKIGIIIAQGVSKAEDLKKFDNFNNIADYFLIDGAISGSGKVFDWSILKDFKSSKPWFLAGGLTLDNILQAIKITNANMIDISSGLEKTRGIKDPDLIIALMKKLNKIS
jgi:phosphoribosylanthranilate isomerase